MNKFFIAMLLIAGVSYALNLGSSVKTNPVETIVNDTAEFNILFWTADNETYIVKLEILQKPENWRVALGQREIRISRNKGNEMIFASDYISATSVVVFADPRGSNPGTYDIIISAKNSPEFGQVLMTQERIFNLTTMIKNRPDNSVLNIEIPIRLPEDIENKSNSILTVLIIVFISALIYRYS